MNEEVLYFFDKHPDALPLYETFERKVRELVPDVLVKVQKTQISFYNKHMFVCKPLDAPFTHLRCVRNR